MLTDVSDDDDEDADENAAGDATMACEASSSSITSCSLAAAVATQAHSCGTTQQYGDPCPQETHHPTYASPASVQTRGTPSLLTRQQVYMTLCVLTTKLLFLTYFARFILSLAF